MQAILYDGDNNIAAIFIQAYHEHIKNNIALHTMFASEDFLGIYRFIDARRPRNIVCYHEPKCFIYCMCTCICVRVYLLSMLSMGGH